jgi:hypothetical protein
VKPDSNRNVNSQSDHIVIIRNDTIREAATCYAVPECPTQVSGCNSDVTYTKPASAYVGSQETPLFKGIALTQSEYALLKHFKCSLQDEASVAGISGQPFAGST